MSIWSSIKNVFTDNEHKLAAEQQLAADLACSQACKCTEATAALEYQIADLQKQLEEAHAQVTEQSDVIEQLREVAVEMRTFGKFKKADQALLEKTDALLEE